MVSRPGPRGAGRGRARLGVRAAVGRTVRAGQAGRPRSPDRLSGKRARAGRIDPRRAPFVGHRAGRLRRRPLAQRGRREPWNPGTL